MIALVMSQEYSDFKRVLRLLDLENRVAWAISDILGWSLALTAS